MTRLRFLLLSFFGAIGAAAGVRYSRRASYSGGSTTTVSGGGGAVVRTVRWDAESGTMYYTHVRELIPPR